MPIELPCVGDLEVHLWVCLCDLEMGKHRMFVATHMDPRWSITGIAIILISATEWAWPLIIRDKSCLELYMLWSGPAINDGLVNLPQLMILPGIPLSHDQATTISGAAQAGVCQAST